MTHKPEVQLDAPAKANGNGDGHLAIMQRDSVPNSVSEIKSINAANELAKGESAKQHLPTVGFFDSESVKNKSGDDKPSDTKATPPNLDSGKSSGEESKPKSGSDVSSLNGSAIGAGGDFHLGSSDAPPSNGGATGTGGDVHRGGSDVPLSSGGVTGPGGDIHPKSTPASGQNSGDGKLATPASESLAIRKRINDSYERLKQMSHLAPDSIMRDH